MDKIFEGAEDKLSQRFFVEAPAIDWMAIHGNICLGLRHPKNKGPSRRLAEKFLLMIEDILLKNGVFDKEMIKEIHKTETEETIKTNWSGMTEKVKDKILIILREKMLSERKRQEYAISKVVVEEAFREEMEVQKAIEEIEKIP